MSDDLGRSSKTFSLAGGSKTQPRFMLLNTNEVYWIHMIANINNEYYINT